MTAADPPSAPPSGTPQTDDAAPLDEHPPAAGWPVERSVRQLSDGRAGLGGHWPDGPVGRTGSQPPNGPAGPHRHPPAVVGAATSRSAELPEVAWATALAALPDVGPARLHALLERGPAPDVFAALRAGHLDVDAALAAACGRDPAILVERWRAAARELDVEELWSAHRAARVVVLRRGGPGWPLRLDDDPDPPELLYLRGDSRALTDGAPTVAIVGTRRCSHYGMAVAGDLGRDLTDAGVRVVSGLAAGIDGAAHGGALQALTRRPPSDLDGDGAGPIGIVGTGLDVVYPKGHRSLWGAVADAGALVSEFPLGTGPARWRFPARNRIIAGLADAVVIVESDLRGGAMHTVDEALRRERPVLAVPGPVTVASSAGTNRLLRDVATPCCDVEDVLVAIDHVPRRARHGGNEQGAGQATTGVAHDQAGEILLTALGGAPATLEQLVGSTGLGIGEAALALEQLAGAGLVRTDGAWYERRASASGRRHGR